MTRLDGRSLPPLAVPAFGTGAILAALLFARGDIPWIPVLSEMTGLVAALFAVGLSAEPALRTKQWTLVERFGLASAVSAACVALSGLGLHLAAQPVTTTNILTILLVVSAIVGALSVRYRAGTHSRPLSRDGRVDVIAGLASLALLVAAIGMILAFRPGPEPPPLEVALIDESGALLAMPLRVQRSAEHQLNVALRSPSGSASQTTVSILGAGVRSWSVDGIVPTRSWSIITVPVLAMTSGIVEASIEVRMDRSILRLPIELESVADAADSRPAPD